MRLCKRLSLAVLSAVVAIELFLQAGAVAVACAHPGAATGTPGADVICVGDSFTYGLGAERADLSYPAQLEAKLGEPWTVRNLGFPARTSKDVLDVLYPELQEAAPRYVCVLVGVNDSWNPPPRWTRPQDDGPGFRVQWRTPRLVAWLWGWLRGELAGGSDDAAVTAAPADPAGGGSAHAARLTRGRWSMGALTVEFAPDGTVVGLGLPATWRLRGADLEITFQETPYVGAASGNGWQLELPHGACELRPAGEGAPEPLATWADPLAEARALEEAGDVEGAIAAYREQLDAPVCGAKARGRLACLLRESGDAAGARALVEELERDWRADPSRRALADGLLTALSF